MAITFEETEETNEESIATDLTVPSDDEENHYEAVQEQNIQPPEEDKKEELKGKTITINNLSDELKENENTAENEDNTQNIQNQKNDITPTSEEPEKKEKKTQTDEQKKKNKKIILPKSFEYLVTYVEKYNEILNRTEDTEFIKKAINDALAREIEKKTSEIAENFAMDFINKVEKDNYFEKAEEQEKINFMIKTDLQNGETEGLEILELNINKINNFFKTEIVFNPNCIYDFYISAVKNNKQNVEYLEDIMKISFFTEDYFDIVKDN